MRYFFFILLYCSIYASSARVVTYNLLNFSDEDEREDDFITIIEYIQPDIIIAQEVNEVLPEATFINKTDGFMGIHDNHILAVTIKAIQDQQDIIENQKKRNC